MNCRELLELLSEYIEGELPPELRGEIECHVEECPQCKLVIDTLKLTIKLYNCLEPCTLPEKIKEEVLGKLKALHERRKHGTFKG